MNKTILYVALGVFLLGGSFAQAQETESVSGSAASEALSEEEMARKVQLAEKMHEINPVQEQVDSAVNSVASRLPEIERQTFLNAIYSTMNYKAIERISVDAMVEVYSVAELEAMVEYYSKPEAKSAGDKIPQWAGKVQPEIMRMIDKAMIKARTGQ
ncbi:MAG: hypothetical protein OEY94_01025 [Alphaproteobacteria bacterium]|nr:hypothetical protein [Alphaproteobacteria bacterium]